MATDGSIQNEAGDEVYMEVWKKAFREDFIEGLRDTVANVRYKLMLSNIFLSSKIADTIQAEIETYCDKKLFQRLND